MIRFQCPGCRGLLQTPPEMAGKIVACSNCRQAMKVPNLAPVATLSMTVAPDTVTKRASAEVTPRRRLPPPPPEPVDAPALPEAKPRPVRPRRAAPRAGTGGTPFRRRGNPQWPWILTGVLCFLLVASGVGTLLVYKFRSVPTVTTSLKPTTADSQHEVPVVPKNGEIPQVVEKDRGKTSVPGPNLAQKVVDLINEQRKREGVLPVRLDPAHSSGCSEHAAYLKRHEDITDLDPHDQDAALASFSEAGRETARAASIAYREPLVAVKAWLAAPAHRGYLVHSDLKTIGFGCLRSGPERWICVFDFTRGRNSSAKGAFEPIVYPTQAQLSVPIAFPGNEIPDPLPETKDKLAGYPVTATFPLNKRVSEARAWLEDESGFDLPIWLSSPAKPANNRFASLQQNTVCLLAKEPLRSGMRYVVRIETTSGNREWSRSWSFTTQPPAEHRRLIYTRALQRLNYYRKASGLKPVTLDTELSAGCLAHASYMARHMDRSEGFKIDEESPELLGFTELGQRVAKKSAIRVGGGVGPVDAIDWLFASVLNRHLALNPTMTRVAFGAAQQSPRGWLWVIHLPTERRQSDGPDPVLYPGKNQSDVPIYFGREVASMIPEAGDAVAGFGITANFFPLLRVRSVTARLTDASGKDVPCWLSTPEKKLPGTASYAQILLVPKKPLQPATTYTATMTGEVGNTPWSEKWSFTTVNLISHRDTVAEKLLVRMNDARRLAGLNPVTLDVNLSSSCQRHADYIARNLDHPKVQGLGIHDEDLSLPGSSPEGAKAGKASVIALISDPGDSVDGWMATLYHRIPLLDPDLKRVGYGQTMHPSRGWATVLDTGSGK